MANYKAGDVIRLTRNAVGLTQEELSDGICSVETLSRIENNRHKIKRDIYRRLMERLERGIHDNCAVCMGNDLSKREYDISKQYLAHICEKISDSVVDRQYLKRVRALVDYELGEISAQVFIKQLQEAMEMTIPAYESYLWGDQRGRIYPYREQEILILMGMGIAYYDVGELDKDIIIYETIIRSLDAGYMDEKNAAELKLINLANLSRPLGKLGRYEEALAKAEEGLNMAISRGYAHGLVELMMQTAGNRLKLAKRKEADEREKELMNAKKMMRRAYYIAPARKDIHNLKLIKQNIKYFFDEEI